MKQGKNTDFLEFATFTLLAVGVWTGFGIYKAITKATTTKVTSEEVMGITPKLDVEVLDILERRKNFSESELSIIDTTRLDQITPEEAPVIPDETQL